MPGLEPSPIALCRCSSDGNNPGGDVRWMDNITHGHRMFVSLDCNARFTDSQTPLWCLMIKSRPIPPLSVTNGCCHPNRCTPWQTHCSCYRRNLYCKFSSYLSHCSYLSLLYVRMVLETNYAVKWFCWPGNTCIFKALIIANCKVISTNTTVNEFNLNGEFEPFFYSCSL